MKQVRFEANEVPYGMLARYGLTQEKIEDLPLWALEDIGQGRRSPLLPVQVTDVDGMIYKGRTRFAFVRREDDKVDVVFYPQLEKSPLEAYTKEQQAELLAGKAIPVDTKDAQGRNTMLFVQIDTETKQVMSVPTPVIGRNLEVLRDELKLSSAELQVMQKGEPLTLLFNDEELTAGIDLNAKSGIRICKGDEKKWRENAKHDWDKYTFGCYGCWVMDDNGNLDYVEEENYTDELWTEQKKSAQKNAGMSLHK
ncbi:MAG: DUF4099 domain-containing protein [Prevotella sp.]|nr:DUF4099 domain-containing protein [Prevotella sp.]